MAEFLTTSGIHFHIENIIRETKSKLVLVTPYLRLTKTLYDRLCEVDNRKVQITLIFGKKELSEDQELMLGGLRNLSTYFCENLHAKCYFNEEAMVLTSMNLYASSQEQNREMGVLILRQSDTILFNRAVQETKSIQGASRRISLIDSRDFQEFIADADDLYGSIRHSLGFGPKEDAFCIRCRRPRPWNPTEPYCRECYRDWSASGRPFQVEGFCHLCGREYTSSMNKPLCFTCNQRFFR